MVTMTAPSGQILNFGDASQEEMLEALNFLDKNTDILKEPPSVGAPLDRPFELTEAPRIDAPSRQEQQRRIAREKEPVIPEIKDPLFRFAYGRMDRRDEKLGYLAREFGIDAVTEESPNVFTIDQGKVSPEVRERYGLTSSGKILADKPGFSWADLVDFAAEAGPSLSASMIASVAVAGMAAWPAILTVGAVAGGAKAIDEAVEHLQGLNKQSIGEVATAVGFEALLMGVFGEGVGRVATRMLGAIFKGSGPKVSQERVAELIEGGLTQKEAIKAAKEEIKAKFFTAIEGGARPTVEAATGKAIAARALAINEKIIPNPGVGRSNVAYVKKVLNDLTEGKITETEAKDALRDQARVVANLINNEFKDPKKALQMTQTAVYDIIKKDLDQLVDNFSPITGFPTDFVEAAKLNARLFTDSTSQLYKTAEDLIGLEAKNFPAGAAPVYENVVDQTGNIIGRQVTKEGEGILGAIAKAESDNEFLELSSSLFQQIKTAGKSPTIGAAGIPGEQIGTFSLHQLQQMKQALRLAAGDPELVPVAGQSSIANVIRSVDDTLDAKYNELAELILRPSTANLGLPTSKVSQQQLLEGLTQWREANKIWAAGQEQYNKASVNMLVKNTEQGYFSSNRSVLDTIVQKGDVVNLNNYLNAVTPSKNNILALTQSGVAGKLERAKALISRTEEVTKPDGTTAKWFTANTEEIAASNQLIESIGAGKVLPKTNEWLGDIKVPNKYKHLDLEERIQALDDSIILSRMGADPDLIRKSVRHDLARTWITRAVELSPGEFQTINPATFAKQYFMLSQPMRKALFGESAEKMNNIVNDFYIVGNKNAEQLFERLPSLKNESLIKEIDELKNVVDDTLEFSKSELNKAINSGSIPIPEAVVAGILKNPSLYKRLHNQVGEDVLNAPGGVKDMVMRNLLQDPFEQLRLPGGQSAEFVQSGQWGAASWLV
jgi:hypothetical protein